MLYRITTAILAALIATAVAADPIEDYFLQRGPLPTLRVTATGPDNNFTLYRPADMGTYGIRHPVITWGNGTFTIPTFYNAFLDHLASYGFVVIASNALFTGSGAQMIEGVDWVLSENANPASPLFGAIATDAIGATGHSQGGGGAINAGNDPRVRCTAPIEPIPGNVEDLQGPMYLIAGSADSIVPPAGIESNIYDPSPVATIYGLLDGATHFDALGDANGFRGYLTAWFSFCLRGNPIAARAFLGVCTMCNNPAWTVQRKAGAPAQ